MTTHSSILAREIPWTNTVHGAAKHQTTEHSHACKFYNGSQTEYLKILVFILRNENKNYFFQIRKCAVIIIKNF